MADDGPTVILNYDYSNGVIRFEQPDGSMTEQWQDVVSATIDANVQGPIDASKKTDCINGIEYVITNYPQYANGMGMRITPSPNPCA